MAKTLYESIYGEVPKKFPTTTISENVLFNGEFASRHFILTRCVKKVYDFPTETRYFLEVTDSRGSTTIYVNLEKKIEKVLVDGKDCTSITALNFALQDFKTYLQAIVGLSKEVVSLFEAKPASE